MRGSSSVCVALVTILTVVGLSACGKCGKNEAPPPPSKGVNTAQETGANTNTSGDPPEPTEAERMFYQICATCHGTDGTGNGFAAAEFNPKPRNYTDPTWQASVTDDEIKKTIVLGGAAVGKSALMPPNPTLKDKPAVLDGIVKIIRAFGKQK